MKRTRFGQKGFTLVELIFVLAIIVTLVGIFLPLAMDRLSQSKTARASADADAISAALTKFFNDVDHFPACNSGDCSSLSSSNNDLKFLAFGTGSGSLTSEYPTHLNTTGSPWALTTNDETNEERNNAFNHLVQNDPNRDGSAGSTSDYKTTKWKGPYIAKLAVDPFGFAYIAGVGAMERSGSPVTSGARGWILSAGPDGNLDTSPTASVLSNDDIGYIFFTNS